MQIVIEKTETFMEHDIIAEGVKVGNVGLCPEKNYGYCVEVVGRMGGDTITYRVYDDGRIYER